MACCAVLSHSVVSYSLWLHGLYVSCQAPLFMGILQVRTLEWVSMPSFRGSSQLRDQTQVSHIAGASLVAQRLKHLPAMQEIWVQSLGRENPLEKEMATHSSMLAWRIPWTGEPGRLQSTGSQRVGHDWATSLALSLPFIWTTREANKMAFHPTHWISNRFWLVLAKFIKLLTVYACLSRCVCVSSGAVREELLMMKVKRC